MIFRHSEKTGGWRMAAILAVISLTIPSGADLRAGDFPLLSKSDLDSLQASFADLADQVLPSCVAVRTYISRTRLGGRKILTPMSQGAGVIYRSDGYVLTNFHVIEDAPIVFVVLNSGLEYEADVVQADIRSDLAVLKIDEEGLPAARFGDVDDVRVGHWVFAVGNPFGLANLTGRSSFSVGNVSSLGRAMTNQIDPSQKRYYGNLIETSAAINPGNSGGPLFNLDGEVIGIVAAIETRSGANEGVGFAIPMSHRNRAIVAKLEDGEQIHYGFLGVNVNDGPRAKKHELAGRLLRAAEITGIAVPGGPAERAGLRAKDIIIEFDGTPIEDADHLVRLVGATPVGSRVKVRYVRNGREHAAYVMLADRDTTLVSGREGEPEVVVSWRGATLAERVSNSKRRRNDAASDKRLVIVEVKDPSEAQDRGLKVNDEVVAINGRRVRSLDAFAEVVNQIDGAISVRLRSNRVISFPAE